LAIEPLQYGKPVSKASGDSGGRGQNRRLDLDEKLGTADLGLKPDGGDRPFGASLDRPAHCRDEIFGPDVDPQRVQP
jgi:hypothetical protein